MLTTTAATTAATTTTATTTATTATASFSSGTKVVISTQGATSLFVNTGGGSGQHSRGDAPLQARAVWPDQSQQGSREAKKTRKYNTLTAFQKSALELIYHNYAHYLKGKQMTTLSSVIGLDKGVLKSWMTRYRAGDANAVCDQSREYGATDFDVFINENIKPLKESYNEDGTQKNTPPMGPSIAQSQAQLVGDLSRSLTPPGTSVEYSDEAGPSGIGGLPLDKSEEASSIPKKRRPRSYISSEKTAALKATFDNYAHYLSDEDFETLAGVLGLPTKTVSDWFRGRRRGMKGLLGDKTKNAMSIEAFIEAEIRPLLGSSSPSGSSGVTSTGASSILGQIRGTMEQSFHSDSLSRLSERTVKILEESFDSHKYSKLSDQEVERLVEETKLSDVLIREWYKRRRRKEKGRLSDRAAQLTPMILQSVPGFLNPLIASPMALVAPPPMRATMGYLPVPLIQPYSMPVGRSEEARPMDVERTPSESEEDETQRKLESSYAINPEPRISEYCELAADTLLPLAKVMSWFRSRRRNDENLQVSGEKLPLKRTFSESEEDQS
ncbi:MAG: homeobox domain-containing protein [Endozoicomonas sp.]